MHRGVKMSINEWIASRYPYQYIQELNFSRYRVCDNHPTPFNDCVPLQMSYRQTRDKKVGILQYHLPERVPRPPRPNCNECDGQCLVGVAAYRLDAAVVDAPNVLVGHGTWRPCVSKDNPAGCN